MRQPNDTPTDEGTFEDLLWELDVTTARDEPLRRSRPKGAAETTAPREPGPPSTASTRSKPTGRGRFHRPELETPWERLSRNRLAQVAGATVLLGGTALLVVVALSR